MDLVETPCLLCNQSETIPLHREGAFQMVQCASCRFVFCNPRPTEQALDAFYQDYLPENPSSIATWKKMMKPVFRRAALTIRQHRQKGKLLDVGTGFGFFLEEMRSLGWEVEGIEISRQGMDYARKAFNLNLYPGPLENARFRDNEFDAVTAFYVIEHLPSPNRFLRECLRILKPGGLLLLRYPHTTPIKNLLHTLGIKNRLYDLPAHLSDFSPSAMQRCLTAAGFTRCRHWIGGVTVPGPLGKRLVTFLFGYSAEALFLLSGGRFLLPGVSKSVTAYKETPSPGVRKEQDG